MRLMERVKIGTIFWVRVKRGEGNIISLIFSYLEDNYRVLHSCTRSFRQVYYSINVWIRLFRDRY